MKKNKTCEPLKEEQQDEANTTTGGSVASDIKGVQMPLGAQGKKKKNNPNKPFGDDEIKEAIAALADEMYEMIDLDETVVDRPDGKHSVVNPITGAEEGSYDSRETARQVNRQKGYAGGTPGTASATQATTSTGTVAPVRSVDPVTGKARTGSKKKKSSKPSAGGKRLSAAKQYFRESLKKAGLALVPIEEASMISYVFEDGRKDSMWEGFLSKIPRESVMADVGLSEALKAMAVAEARVLAKSVMEIKKVLEGTGCFMVERKRADQCPDSGDVRMPFTVSIGEGAQPLLFAVKLEGARPSILFPEASRNVLNNLLTKESKLLRAELMHVQETALDKIEDVLEAAQSRDFYLNNVQGRLKEMINGLSLVETAIMKNLVRNKLKGAK